MITLGHTPIPGTLKPTGSNLLLSPVSSHPVDTQGNERTQGGLFRPRSYSHLDEPIIWQIIAAGPKADPALVPGLNVIYKRNDRSESLNDSTGRVIARDSHVKPMPNSKSRKISTHQAALAVLSTNQ